MEKERLNVILETLRHTPTGNICDAMRRVGVSCYMKGLTCLQGDLDECMVGQASTISYSPKQAGYEKSGLGQFQLVRATEPGSVLIFAARGTQCWVTGANVGQMMMTQGLTGLIVDGCVRDKKELSQREKPVYCLGSGTKPYAEVIQADGFNVPVDVCGARVNPGDIVVGDGDGVCIIPLKHLEKVYRQLEDLADIEAKLPVLIQNKASLEEINVIANRKSKVVE